MTPEKLVHIQTPMPKPVVNLQLGQRVREARKAVPMTQAELAKLLNLKQSAITEIEAGRINRPKKLREIARITGRSEAWLLGESNDPNGDTEAPTSTDFVGVPIVGIAEAGIFREVDPFSDALDPARVSVPRDRRVPQATLKAYLVQGDSMVDAGILDGDTVITADFMESGLPLRDNMIVVAQRTRDGGQTFELTVKRVKTYKDHIELVPCSSNPKYKPFVFKNMHDDVGNMDGEEVRVLGIVLRVTKEVPI